MRRYLRKLISLEKRTAIMAVVDNFMFWARRTKRTPLTLSNKQNYERVWGAHISIEDESNYFKIVKVDRKFKTMSIGELSARQVATHLDFLNGSSAARALEIGAGGGSIILALAKLRPDIEFVGIEPTLNGCEFIRSEASRLALTNVSSVQAVGQDEMKDIGKFDFVYSNLCLEQIADKDTVKQVLRNIRRISTNGRCSFLEPWLDRNNFLHRSYLVEQGYLYLHSSVLTEMGFANVSSKDPGLHNNPRFRLSHVTCYD